MSLQPIQTLWLDALVASRATLHDSHIRELWNKTILVPDNSIPVLFQPASSDEPGVKLWRVPDLTSLPSRIEQREAMLAIIAYRIDSFTTPLKGRWHNFDDLCWQLGCLPDKSSIISERWRRLAILRNVAELPYSSMEDRPQCKICAGPVATGAGWNPRESGFDPEVYGDYRSDVHHECKQYALRVIMPKLRARQAKEAAEASAGVDK